jgi:ABC-type dipeptide/oligopeptide/nickel transport system ATPase component
VSELLRISLSAGYAGRPDVLKHVELDLQQGEILALVGQSGSGKSTIAMAVLGLLATRGGIAQGQVMFEGSDLLLLSERRLREIRGRRIALVPQSPIASLNPALKIGSQFKEAWKAHRPSDSGRWRGEAIEALDLACLPGAPTILDSYPHELSVGLAQRVLIAMAILHRPSLVIADEPTSALDVITQHEILRLFADLNRLLGTSILYISHDLLSVASLSHRVAILHGGEVVETGLTPRIFASPGHSYTARLIASLPRQPSLSPPDPPDPRSVATLMNRSRLADSSKVHTEK